VLFLFIYSRPLLSSRILLLPPRFVSKYTRRFLCVITEFWPIGSTHISLISFIVVDVHYLYVLVVRSSSFRAVTLIWDIYSIFKHLLCITWILCLSDFSTTITDGHHMYSPSLKTGKRFLWSPRSGHSSEILDNIFLAMLYVCIRVYVQSREVFVQKKFYDSTSLSLPKKLNVWKMWIQ
jgi:hypothetical protein